MTVVEESRLRTLPIRVTPVPSESFASYVSRLAEAQNVGVLATLKATGVLDQDHFKTLPKGFGLALTDQQVENFAATTGVEAERIQEMLLSRYEGVAFPAGHSGTSGARARELALQQWVYVAASHVCPLCLEADSAWRVEWKLPWSFACVRHHRLLVGTCPGCCVRTGTGRADGRAAPALPTRVPELGLCNNAVPGGTTGLGAEICGYPLGAIDAESCDGWPELVDAQRRIHALLDEAPGPEVLGVFERARSVAATLLAVGGTDSLGPLADPVYERWEAHVEMRDGAGEVRRAVRAAGGDGRTGPRMRYWTGTPDEPALMAAVLPTAFDIATAEGGRDATAEAVRSLARAARACRPRDGGQIPRWFKFPPELEHPYMNAWRSSSPGFAIAAPSVHDERALRPPEIPRLYWESAFRGELAAMFDGRVGEVYARRFCSMAMARTLGFDTWVQAAEAVELDTRTARAQANRGVTVLGEAHRDRFWDLISEERQRRHAASRRIDYRARRTQLSHFTDVPRETWLGICAEAEVTPGKVRGRSRLAAAWLWAELASDDWHLAPAFKSKANASDVEVYRRFVTKQLPALERQLRALGKTLVGAR